MRIKNQNMPKKKVKRFGVALTKEDMEIVSGVSIRLFGRVNLSATVSYIIRQYVIYKNKERKDEQG